MTDFIACLTTGKGTWGHVARIIESSDFDNIYLITNDFGQEKFTSDKPINKIIINPDKSLSELIEDMKEALKGKLMGTEVALNLISGTGKEHMAIISALIKLGMGFRFLALTSEGVKEV
jgi:hypothetical protein